MASKRASPQEGYQVYEGGWENTTDVNVCKLTKNTSNELKNYESFIKQMYKINHCKSTFLFYLINIDLLPKANIIPKNYVQRNR